MTTKGVDAFLEAQNELDKLNQALLAYKPSKKFQLSLHKPPLSIGQILLGILAPELVKALELEQRGAEIIAAHQKYQEDSTTQLVTNPKKLKTLQAKLNTASFNLKQTASKIANENGGMPLKGTLTELEIIKSLQDKNVKSLVSIKHNAGTLFYDGIHGFAFSFPLGEKRTEQFMRDYQAANPGATFVKQDQTANAASDVPKITVGVTPVASPNIPPAIAEKPSVSPEHDTGKPRSRPKK